MEWETLSPLHRLVNPPDLLPLCWHLADLVQAPVTDFSPALHLAGTSNSRRACGDTTRRCQHPFQRRLRRADLHAEQPCHGSKHHFPSCLCPPDPLLNLISNVCFINTIVQLFNSQATKETSTFLLSDLG